MSTLHVGAVQPQPRPTTREGWRQGGEVWGRAVLEPQWEDRRMAWPSPPLGTLTTADTLQTHSGLFLEELEMLVPSTPTSQWCSGRAVSWAVTPRCVPPAPLVRVVKSRIVAATTWGGAVVTVRITFHRW